MTNRHTDKHIDSLVIDRKLILIDFISMEWKPCQIGPWDYWTEINGLLMAQHTETMTKHKYTQTAVVVFFFSRVHYVFVCVRTFFYCWARTRETTQNKKYVSPLNSSEFHIFLFFVVISFTWQTLSSVSFSK